MPTPYVTGTELRDLAAFLAVGAPDTVGQPRRGEQVVRTSGCLDCHALSGARGPHAGRLDQLKGLESPWTVMAHMWNHAFLMELETQAQHARWPPLTPTDLADLPRSSNR
jgi:hypothetical protein